MWSYNIITRTITIPNLDEAMCKTHITQTVIYEKYMNTDIATKLVDIATKLKIEMNV